MSTLVKRLRKEFERLNALTLSDAGSDSEDLGLFNNTTSTMPDKREELIALQSARLKKKTHKVSDTTASNEQSPQKMIYKKKVSSFNHANRNTINTEIIEKEQNVDKILQLENEITDLRRKSLKKSNLVRHLKDEIDEYKFKDDEESEQMRNTVDELENEVNKHKQNKKHLLEKVSSLSIHNQALLEESDIQRDKIDKLNDFIKQQNLSNTQKLAKSHLELQKSHTEVSSLQNSISSMTKENEKLNIEISALRKYSRDTEHELNESMQQLESSQSQLVSFRKKETNMHAKKNTLVKQLTALKQQYAELQRSVQSKDLTLKEFSKKSESAERKSRTSLLILKQTVDNHQKVQQDFYEFYGILSELKRQTKDPNDTSELRAVMEKSEQRTRRHHASRNNEVENSLDAEFASEDLNHLEFPTYDQNGIAYSKCLNVLGKLVSVWNEMKKEKQRGSKEREMVEDSVEKLEANIQKYRSFIGNLQSNFEKYNHMMEAKIMSLHQNASVIQQSEKEQKQKNMELEELLMYKNRASDELQQRAFEKIDAMKEIERQYDHLSVEHKHLKSKYEQKTNTDTISRSRSRSRSFSVPSSEFNKNQENAEKLKDEIYNLRKALAKSVSKCDELEQVSNHDERVQETMKEPHAKYWHGNG